MLRERAPGVTAVPASATEMPFDDGEFDLSVSVATMHHIADPDSVRRALAEMVRVVRPGRQGHRLGPQSAQSVLAYLMKRVPQDRGDERLVGVDELVDGLRGGGADLLSVAQLGLVPDFVPERLLGVAAAVERAAERTPGLRRVCAHNVVVAVRR